MNYQEEFNNDDEIQEGFIEGEMSYNGFFVRAKYDYSSEEYKIEDDNLYRYPYYYTIDELAIGYRKILNDLFYSESDYELNSVKIEKMRVDYESKNQLIAEKEEIIDKFVEIKNMELESALKRTQLNELKKTMAILHLKLIENEATKIDFNIMRLETDKLKQEINFLQNRVQESKINLFNICGIVDFSYELDELKKIKKQETLVSNNSLKALESQLSYETENLKYLKRQKQWPVELFAQYESVEEEYQLGLSFNFNLFEYHSEEKQKKEDIENVKLEIAEEKLEVENKDKERINELNFLEKNSKTYEELYNVYLQKYSLTQELYLSGDVGLLDYLKTQTETYEINVEFLKVRNNYHALLYKVSLNKVVKEAKELIAGKQI